jgi:glycosyltransferase involved in cell wall biosynthesis
VRNEGREIVSICLSMVVKNESQLIREALRSVKLFVNDWVIVDTGSTDDTQDIISEEMGSIKLRDIYIYNREWKNYGYNRTEAIELAKQSGCDWILILDADERLIFPSDFKMPELNPDHAYWMTVKYGEISYARPNLISVKQNWKYVDVTHEYLMADPMPPAVLLPITIQTHPSRCTKSVERCREDIDILYKRLGEEPNNERYVFYLAQSYRDAGDPENALLHYKRRVTMGGWYEEAYVAQFNVAQIMERLDYSRAEITDAYLQAYNMNSARSEPLGSLARYLRIKGDYPASYLFAKKAVDMTRPNQLLFVDDGFYLWKNKDEFAVSAFWVGQYQECLTACDELLKSGDLPEGERARVEMNRQHALNKIAEQK